jgi:hypothetical protein
MSQRVYAAQNLLSSMIPIPTVKKGKLIDISVQNLSVGLANIVV